MAASPGAAVRPDGSPDGARHLDRAEASARGRAGLTPQPEPVRAGTVGVSATMGEPFTQSSMEYGCVAYQGWRRHACTATRRRATSSVTSSATTARSLAGSRRCSTASGCSRRLASQCLAPGVPDRTICPSTTTYQISTRRVLPLRRPRVLTSHVPVGGNATASMPEG